jgi:hypothetical protein
MKNNKKTKEHKELINEYNEVLDIWRLLFMFFLSIISLFSFGSAFLFYTANWIDWFFNLLFIFMSFYLWISSSNTLIDIIYMYFFNKNKIKK